MTFFTREAAPGVTPVELITLMRGRGVATKVWRYCTLDRDITVSGLTFKAAAITRDAITRNQQTGRTATTLRIAAGTPVVREWQTDAVNDGAGQPTVQILRAHVDADGTVQGSGADQTIVLFTGVLAGLEVKGGVAELACETIATAMATQTVPRIPLSRSCPWSVYDMRCGIDPADHARTATVTSIDTIPATADPQSIGLLGGAPTVELTVSGTEPLLFGVDLDTQFLDTGVLLWTETTADGDVTHRRYIQSASWGAWPAVLAVLDDSLPAGALGETVTLWPGCQKTSPVCFARFANLARFGGFTRLPERNPLLEGVR